MKRLGRLRWIDLALAVGIVGLGTVVTAAEFVWKGGYGNYLFSNTANWDPTGSPTNGDDAIIEITPTASLCTYDLTTAISLYDLTLGGDSPTEMTLHLRDSTLTVDNIFTMLDYGKLDADYDFTVAANGLTNSTTLLGTNFIDVAANVTVNLRHIYVDSNPTTYSPITSVIEATVASGGLLEAEAISVEASTENHSAGLRYDGPGSTFEITKCILVQAKQDCLDGGCDLIKRAKLWVHEGTLKFLAELNPATFIIDGGDDPYYRRADIDVDDRLEADNVTFSSGYSVVDVASGKYFTGGDVTFDVGAVSLKTGAGTMKSGS